MLASEDAPESLGVLSDDSKPLGFYGIHDWQVLKVRQHAPYTQAAYTQRPRGLAQVDDLNPATSFTGQLTDTSQVNKFELSATEYAQRQGKSLHLRVTSPCS